MGTEIAKPPPVDGVQRLVRDFEDRWKSLLPGGNKEKTVERFMVLAVKAIKATPKLMECDKASLLTAIAEAAELGLEPNGALGSGWLLPYKGTVKFVVGYKGLIQMAYRCGRIRMRAQAVYDGDIFEYEEGDKPRLRHVPNLDVEQEDGLLRYAYAVARYPDGTSDFCVMSRKQIDAVKAKSQSAHSDRSPWNTDYAEMAKKCPIRRLAKYLPLVNEEWARLLDKDNEDYDTIQEVPLVRRTIDLTKSEPVAVEEEPREPGSDG